MVSCDPEVLLQLNGWDTSKVQLLENVVTLMMSSNVSTNERTCANKVLNDLKSSEGSWRIVDTILAQSTDVNTKFFALQILEETIATRWKMFSAEEQRGIRNYVIGVTVKLSSDEGLAQSQATFLTKLNKTLIQIVKQEWPEGWPTFIEEICGAAKTAQPLCENNLKILFLLAEDIFDFGKDDMISKKVLKLKGSLTQQFASIFELCMFIFQNHITTPGTVNPSLLKTTLTTLAQFLSWIPLGYVFETQLIDILLNNFWDPLQFRIECCQCLNEIACLNEGVETYQPQIMRCFQMVVQKIQQLPEDAPMSLNNLPSGHRLFWETFLNQLALLLTGFLRYNMGAMMAQPHLVVPALRYLARITMGATDSTFKICLEFWHLFAARLYVDIQNRRSGEQRPLLLSITAPSGQTEPVLPSTNLPMLGDAAHGIDAYSGVLSDVRGVLIDRMAKPPEVRIKETEEGVIERQEEEDTDEVALYKSMREALIYLTNLDHRDMEDMMLCRLSRFVNDDPSAWSATQLNRVCWAVGSISGGLSECDEKAFLVNVVRDLLTLCEQKRGKENKAVVASNIMYVVGQYPRFLKQHWKFLRTVILKLMEFMHETFPGVQEMAVETFLKIVQKCKKKFVVIHPLETGTFLEQIIGQIHQDIQDLHPLHLCTFFETVGTMISAAPNEQKEQLIANLMVIYNQRWQTVLQFANADSASLRDQNVISELSLILRVNERVASAVGYAFGAQLSHIYVDMLRVYKVFSETISQQTQQHGMSTVAIPYIKGMRIVKRDALRLVQTFVERSVAMMQDGNAISEQQLAHSRKELAERFLPPLLEPVLQDYKNNIPQARDAEVLDLLAVFAARLPNEISAELRRIFEMVFECTLEMIKSDFQSFPDHRVKLYDMLKAVNNHCFEALLLNIPETQIRLYVDSLIWAIRHEHIAVADVGLKIMYSFLEKLMTGPPQLYLQFFRIYYFQLMTDILGVLTDTLHKSGAKMQVQILHQLISAANSNQLADIATPTEVMERLYNILASSFKNLTTPQAKEFVVGLFARCGNEKEFLQHIHDFLIELKEWGGGAEMLSKDAQEVPLATADIQQRLLVPGLVPPHDPSRAELEKDMDEL
eukprot:GEMP01001771.1.p1 GENE.GEMP01001771.1~~GEMP01001771.1.p1  ORF type:complete len:1108 (+),score=186.25 GEMP01001771.1:155-3478(+)